MTVHDSYQLDFFFPWIVLTTSSFPGICQCFDMFWRPLLGTWTCNLEGMLLEIPHPTCSGWNDTQLDGLLDSSAGAYPINIAVVFACEKKQLKTVTKLLADSRITMVGTIYIWAEMMFQKSSYSRNFISSWLQSRCSSTDHASIGGRFCALHESCGFMTNQQSSMQSVC